MVRISSRPDVAALSDPVKVSTIIKPNSSSEVRSTGSRIDLRFLVISSGITMLILLWDSFGHKVK
jgi:hypothetical protein